MAKKNHKMLLYGGIAVVAIIVLWRMGYLSKITGIFGKKTAPPLPVQKNIPPYTSPYVNAPSMTKANPAMTYRPRCSACSGNVSTI